MLFPSPPQGQLLIDPSDTASKSPPLIAPRATSIGGFLVECLPPIGEKVPRPPPPAQRWVPAAVASGGSSPTPSCIHSCCSHFLLGSLSPGPPSSESHSQRLLPHKPQLPGPGGAGSRQAPSRWPPRAGQPPLPTRGQLSSLSTQLLSAPLIRKPGRMRRLLTKVEVSHLGCSLQVQAPRTTAQSRGGGCLHRGGGCAFPRPSRFPVLRGPTAYSLENGARREPQHQCG